MARTGIRRLRSRLKGLWGIRGRLVLMSLILVVPMMIDRVVVLEQTRAGQVRSASEKLRLAARNSALAEREVISSIEALLRSSAYTYVVAASQGRGCAILRASAQVDLPWVKSLSMTDLDGTVHCSTLPGFLGRSLKDRDYFRRVTETHQFTLSNFVVGRGTSSGTIAGAYSTLAFDPSNPAIVIASINLDWLSKRLLLDQTGADGYLIDGAGSIIATHLDDPSLAGKQMPDIVRLGSLEKIDRGYVALAAEDGTEIMVAHHRVPGTDWRVIVRADKAVMLASIDADIQRAYWQLALVVLIALAGAFFASERLIIRPLRIITGIVQRLGTGDWAARKASVQVPSEFTPLVRAFNVMAGQLAARERELIASNDRLTVMASNDLVSGLANRRGFQSRLDFEWLKAEHNGDQLALVMVDIDHFKLFNDTYGHPEGDTCLARVGEVLSAVASETLGFAARYGGEESCLLLPGANSEQALLVGQAVRTRIEGLAIPHAASPFGCVTLSAGIAKAQPQSGYQPLDLIEAADAALYQAKSAGRNRVAVHRLIGFPMAIAS